MAIIAERGRLLAAGPPASVWAAVFFAPPIVTAALVSIPLRLLGVRDGVSEIVTPVIALPVAAYVTFLVWAAKVRNE